MLKTDSIDIVIRKKRDFFSSGTTQDINFRKQQLKNLRNLIDDNENEILEALHKDLKKTEFEGCLTAVIGAKIEINYALKNINKWTKIVVTIPFAMCSFFAIILIVLHILKVNHDRQIVHPVKPVEI